MGREFDALQTTVRQLFAQFEQNTAANRLLVEQQLADTSRNIQQLVSNILHYFKNEIISQLQQNRDTQNSSPAAAEAIENDGTVQNNTDGPLQHGRDTVEVGETVDAQ